MTNEEPDRKVAEPWQPASIKTWGLRQERRMTQLYEWGAAREPMNLSGGVKVDFFDWLISEAQRIMKGSPDRYVELIQKGKFFCLRVNVHEDVRMEKV